MSGPAPKRASSAPHSNPVSAASKAVMPTYARKNIVFERGQGAWLYTSSGEPYLDFASGVAVTALGHAHPHLVEALREQAGKLWHTSNLYRVAGQERLGERLCAQTFADLVFFCNSGTEAVEGAIKAARRYHHVNGNPDKNRIITFEGAFHGRTLAALSAGGSTKMLDGFAPVADGFDHVPFADMDALEKAISPQTAAIMVEPVQGEGGVRVLSKKQLQHIRKLCDQHELLFVLDEVQTGMGRTGHLFAHQAAGITPDIMAIAKGLGGGFPVGAVLTTNHAGVGMTPGTHGSTFGGNLLAMAAANAVMDVMLEPDFLETVRDRERLARQALAELQDRFPKIIKEIRGQGLLMGLQLSPPVDKAMNAAINHRLLLVAAADNVVRILPPLNVSEQEIRDAISRLASAFQDLETEMSDLSTTDRSPVRSSSKT